MTGSRVWVILLGGLAAVLTGCTATMMAPLEDQLAAPDNRCHLQEVALSADPDAAQGQDETVYVADASGELSRAYVLAVVKGRATIDPLLDCTLAGAATREAKLYRGHVVVSLLVAYGAYNYEIGAYEERVGDAVTYLAHVRQAVLALRGASKVMGGGSTEAFASRQRRLERVLYVLEVALYSERPSLRRANGRVRSVLGAVGLGDSGGVLHGAVHGALTGLKKSVRLRHFGRAYLLDAKEDLQRFADAGSPSRADWKRRDRMIETNCARIAEIAGLEDFRCTLP